MKKKFRKIISLIFTLLLFISCHLKKGENDKLDKLTEKFNKNRPFFDSLVNSCQLFSEKMDTIPPKLNFGLDQLLSSKVSTFLTIDQIKTLKINSIIPYLASYDKIGVEIYFNDFNDENLFIRYAPGFDSTKNIGRRPLKKILYQNPENQNSWLIQNEN